MKQLNKQHVDFYHITSDILSHSEQRGAEPDYPAAVHASDVARDVRGPLHLSGRADRRRATGRPLPDHPAEPRRRGKPAGSLQRRGGR